MAQIYSTTNTTTTTAVLLLLLIHVLYVTPRNFSFLYAWLPK